MVCRCVELADAFLNLPSGAQRGGLALEHSHHAVARGDLHLAAAVPDRLINPLAVLGEGVLDGQRRRLALHLGGANNVHAEESPVLALRLQRALQAEELVQQLRPRHLLLRLGERRLRRSLLQSVCLPVALQKDADEDINAPSQEPAHADRWAVNTYPG